VANEFADAIEACDIAKNWVQFVALNQYLTRELNRNVSVAEMRNALECTLDVFSFEIKKIREASSEASMLAMMSTAIGSSTVSSCAFSMGTNQRPGLGCPLVLTACIGIAGRVILLALFRSDRIRYAHASNSKSDALPPAGCSCFAFARYAALISSGVAIRSTPRISYKLGIYRTESRPGRARRLRQRLKPHAPP
jgi:hypothetical protein